MATPPVLTAFSMKYEVEIPFGSVFVDMNQSQDIFIKSHGKHLKICDNPEGLLSADWVADEDVYLNSMVFMGRVSVPTSNVVGFVVEVKRLYQGLFDKKICPNIYSFLQPRVHANLDLERYETISIQELVQLDLIGMGTHRDFKAIRCIKKGEFVCALTVICAPQRVDSLEMDLKDRANCRMSLVIVSGAEPSRFHKLSMVKITATKKINVGEVLSLRCGSDITIQDKKKK